MAERPWLIVPQCFSPRGKSLDYSLGDRADGCSSGDDDLAQVVRSDFLQCCGRQWADWHQYWQHTEETHGVDLEDASLAEFDLDLEFDLEEIVSNALLFRANSLPQTPSCVNRSSTENRKILSRDDPRTAYSTAPKAVGRTIPGADPRNMPTLDAGEESGSYKEIYSFLSGREEAFEIDPGSLVSSPSGSILEAGIDDRPYKCPVPGCGKAYRNTNGLKYHSAHGHCENDASFKRFRCPQVGCHKRYKNPNGLKYHLAHAHKEEPQHRWSIG